MLKAYWTCTFCGWEGTTEQLAEDSKGNKICPTCGQMGGLE